MRVPAVCCFLFFVFAALPVKASPLALEAGSAVLMDTRSQRLLYEQDSTRKIPPASLTKVMSMFVVLDAVKAGKLSLRAPVRISKAAACVGGSKMHLRAGERVRLDDLLRGMAVVSANDASAAVAEYAAGSQAAFVAMMNRKAAQLGMKNTVFKTPHGLPAKGQVTTAADMLRLACRYLEAHPSARHYHSTPAMLHNGMLMQNTNKLLGHDAVSGLKTGFTRESGYNIILTSTRRGREMVGVLMNAPSAEVRTREAQRLLEYGAHLKVADAPASRRSAKGTTMQTVSSAAGKRSKASPAPRRVLPQTASLPTSAQGSRLH
ncbi:MAG: D-alanyl-D-alanine carboxypeptidase [Deltaproteobacteria bacterium]|jgi:D-alanyl-D-alanine carboxypeptidase (penicillin-binding protein 5/6)|nr:D-alanyl-D-alanine carboxypeptidase [Deltaproteobacteria bacterium]